MNDQNLITIQHANETRSGHNFVGEPIDENMGTNLQAVYNNFYTKTAINFVNKKISIIWAQLWIIGHGAR